MKQMLINLLPVFLIIGLGMLANRIKFLNDDIVGGLKNIIIRLALPGVLFLAFSQSELQVKYLFIIFTVFLFCVLLYGVGSLFHKLIPKLFPYQYTNAFFTSFEFGMIGVGLFTAIWGMDKLPVIALVAFGHEIFVWFVFLPILEARASLKFNPLNIIKDFIKSPNIIGILLGILVNALDILPVIQNNIIGEAVLNGITMMGNTIAPLILLVIGYSLKFKKIPLRNTLVLLFSRWSIVLFVGVIMVYLFKLVIPDIDPFLIKAFYAFILLPPSFVLPLFINNEQKNERNFFSEILVYYTVMSFVAYVVLMSI